MSRFRRRNENKRVRKQSRTNPLRGHKDYADGRDDGKYWRCWNCGFVCDVERDELGGGDGVSHTVYEALYTGGPKKGANNTDYLETDAAIHGDNSSVPLLAIASGRTGHVLLQNDAAGDPQTVRVNWTPDVTSGCPFCDTRNWRGDN